MSSFTDFLAAPVSNGNPTEQALIRRWWRESEGGRGRLVWEYCLEGRFADAVWFPNDPESGVECDGKAASRLYPVMAMDVFLCEAKRELTPELVGQALVYSVFATKADANLRGTFVFAETAADSMRQAARELGLSVVIGSSPPEPPNTALQLTASGRS